jgi:hypothetical protein
MSTDDGSADRVHQQLVSGGDALALAGMAQAGTLTCRCLTTRFPLSDVNRALDGSHLGRRLHEFGDYVVALLGFLLLVRMRNPRQLRMDREPTAAAFLEGIDEFIVAAIVLLLYLSYDLA